MPPRTNRAARHSARWTPAALAILAGSAHALAAGPFPASLDLSSLNGTNGFVLTGIDGVDFSGGSVSSAGDVNGDGVDDLIIGAYLADPGGVPYAGESYVVFGGAGVGAGGTFDLSTLNGTNGFVLTGISTYDFSGSSVSSAGDVNGDGVDDLIVGAYKSDQGGASEAGATYVVFGGAGVGAGGSLDLSTLNGTNGFALSGIDAYDHSGTSVSSAGDVNADGVDDLIIGAVGGDPGGVNYAGETYVVFGAPGIGAGGSLNLSTLDGTNGFVANGIDPDDLSARAVSSAGDVNGDGVDDLIIGAPRADAGGVTQAGESYVVFGGAGIGTGGSLDLSTLNGANGFVASGIDFTDSSGNAVSSAGDVNADGFDDVIIGAEYADPGGTNSAGECYVVFGAPTVGSGGSLNLSTLDGTNGFVVNGIDPSDRCGHSVSSAGDVNGDGVDDLIIGATSADPGGANYAGESYVVFGAPGLGAGGSLDLSTLDGISGFVANGIEAVDLSGSSVSGAGDVNADGIDDVIIGAPRANPGGVSDAGESYVLFGRLANAWSSPTGGDFDTASNWIGGAVPAGGQVVIDTALGVTVTGPAGFLDIDSLTLGAASGRTTLDTQQNSLISIAGDFTVSASAAISGRGTVVTGAAFTNDGLIEPGFLTFFSASGLTNEAQIKLSALGTAPDPAQLEVFGPLANAVLGEIIIRGAVEFTSDDLTNSGNVDMAFADANIAGPVTNAGIPNGPGYDPLGVVTISGASQILFTDDLFNQSDIVLTEDSSIVTLGQLSGNGVSGPGGGPAGSVFAKGGLSPGFLLAPGVASFGGDLDLDSANTTTIRIGGTNPGANHDQITTLANLGAGGTLVVTLINGYTPQPGDVYQVLDFATTSGSFSSIVLDQTLIDADTSNLLIDGTIVIAPPPACNGDIDNDGATNVFDFAILAANFGQSVTPGTNGDLDDNGTVNVFDFAIFAADFGCTS